MGWTEFVSLYIKAGSQLSSFTCAARPDCQVCLSPCRGLSLPPIFLSLNFHFFGCKFDTSPKPTRTHPTFTTLHAGLVIPEGVIGLSLQLSTPSYNAFASNCSPRGSTFHAGIRDLAGLIRALYRRTWREPDPEPQLEHIPRWGKARWTTLLRSG